MKRRRLVPGALTPLLDTLFLLLFALLVVSDTRSSTRTEPVRVHLPAVEPGPATAASPAPRVALEIDADSRVRLADGAPVASRAELDRLLAEHLGDRLPEELIVEIRADAASRSGVALELLQHLLLRGFVRVELLAQGRDDLAEGFGQESG